MTWFLLLLSLARAEPEPEFGLLEVDAKIPAEILVDGVKLAQLYFPGRVSFHVAEGEHALRVYVSGQPSDLPLTMTAGERSRLVVGRNGVTVDETALEEPELASEVPVEFRVVGTIPAQVRLGGTRHTIAGGDRLQVQVTRGAHDLSVRSADGTVIWATGQLSLTGPDPVVVHIAEGRMPEVSGQAVFRTSGG